jgi:excisionase family DNA binding protein
MIAMSTTFLTIQETAQKLKVSTRTVRRWIKQGDLPAFKIGKTVRILEKDITLLPSNFQSASQSHVSFQALATGVLSRLDTACEQIRAHVGGEVEDSVDVLARVRKRSMSNE